MVKALVLFNSFYLTSLLNKYRQILIKPSHIELLDKITSENTVEDLDGLISLFSLYTEKTNQIPFRRLSGADTKPGLLDSLKSQNVDVKFLSLEKYYSIFEQFYEVDFIIAPMTMQDIPDLYNITDKLKIPVFPRTFHQWEAKINQRRLLSTFDSSLLLPFFYIPKAKNFDLNKVQIIIDKFKKLQIEYVFVKDDEGFHSGSTYPYYHCKLENLSSIMEHYANARVSLIIEPLITTVLDNKRITRIVKIHGFGGIHKQEYLEFNVFWSSLEGKYGSETIAKIERIDEEIDLGNFPYTILNEFINQRLPFNLTSMDFAKNLHGNYYSIDINHAAGTWGEVQETGRILDNTIFDQMVSTMCNTSFDDYKNRLELVESQFTDIPQKPIFFDGTEFIPIVELE
ncbi:MAG: hypothetical protein OEZ01_14470 [Candidatus Heimdallarchaeota archaeon]|nr:hypothetical protein [Candidatus Heimdallarchaeota archaeon]MDH5647213.1 hypothetical protein [Candidatus Heimdallarchaeota archaeon]